MIRGDMKFRSGQCQTVLAGAVSILMLLGCEARPGQSPDNTAKAKDSAVAFQLQAAPVGWRDQLINQANQLKGQISARFPELQAQRDRQGQLTAELLNKSASGCFAEMKLAKLEILVKGSWLPRRPLGASGSPLSDRSAGNPSSVTFQFSDSLAVVNDEQTAGMFQPAGRKVVTELAEYKLGDIEYIRITKGGAAFDSERVCEDGGLFQGQDCEYENYEEARLELDSLELKIDGESFYKRDAIKKQLQHGSLEWRDDQLRINEAWLKLMSREDCAQGQ